jgi:flagellar motor protein MotB
MSDTLSESCSVGKEHSGNRDILISAITDMLQKINLSQAADLASFGRYSEAEHLLKGSEAEGGESPAELDLLARIRAQQGRFSEAEGYWNRAIALDPGNGAYQEGLRRIATERKGNLFLRKRGVAVLCMVGAVVLASIWIATMRHMDGMEARLKSNIAAMASRFPKVNPAREMPIISFDIPGISQKKEGDTLVFLFDSGLFLRGTKLRNDALPQLEALAKYLQKNVGKIQVTVVGFSDSSPMPKNSTSYLDNSSLALARSVAVVEILRSNATLPSGMFSLSGLGETATPFTNDSRNNRLRNRTVVLKIRKSEE